MKPKILFLPLLCILCSGCALEFRPEPALLTMNYRHLLEIEESISKKSPVHEAAYQRLCKEADNALNLPAYTVINKSTIPPSGDRRDYMSQAPYWWPDTTKSDGLPYIRRDGQRNPESEESRFDKLRLTMMTEDVMSLTLAWFFSGNENYAEKASDLIVTWFIDPETGVNPNLNYAQAIPGIVEGRGIGIIDTRRYIEIIDAVKLLEHSNSWNRRMTRSLQDWFSHYLEWLVESKNGLDEQAKENNHGTWYDVQAACYAMFVGNNDLARTIIQESGMKRINNQIDSLGRQEYELARTRSFSYSVFNLEALILIGRMGEMMGIKPWGEDHDSTDKVRLACDFLFRYIDRMDEWPYEQITSVDWARLLPLVVEASRIFETSEYNKHKELLEEKLKSNDRLLITKI